MGKHRRTELESAGNFVAKTVLVESANQFSLEELCRTECSLKYFFTQPYRPSDLLQTLKTSSDVPVPMKSKALHALDS